MKGGADILARLKAMEAGKASGAESVSLPGQTTTTTTTATEGTTIMQGPNGGQTPAPQPPPPARGGAIEAIGLMIPVKVRTRDGSVRGYHLFGPECVGREQEVIAEMQRAGWEVDEFVQRSEYPRGGGGGGGYQGRGYGGGGYNGGGYQRGGRY